MELKLNIYKGREIEKTYTANEFNIMMGVLDDLFDAIDIDALTGNGSDADFVGAVAKTVFKGYGQIKTILKEIFPDVTDSELRRVRMNDVVHIVIEVLKHGIFNINQLSGKK